MEHNDLYSGGSLPTFRRNMPSQFSGLKFQARKYFILGVILRSIGRFNRLCEVLSKKMRLFITTAVRTHIILLAANSHSANQLWNPDVYYRIHSSSRLSIFIPRLIEFTFLRHIYLRFYFNISLYSHLHLCLQTDILLSDLKAKVKLSM
jgi:hypothetical protein